jgi:hypothetical protein
MGMGAHKAPSETGVGVCVHVRIFIYIYIYIYIYIRAYVHRHVYMTVRQELVYMRTCEYESVCIYTYVRT